MIGDITFDVPKIKTFFFLYYYIYLNNFFKNLIIIINLKHKIIFLGKIGISKILRSKPIEKYKILVGFCGIIQKIFFVN